MVTNEGGSPVVRGIKVAMYKNGLAEFESGPGTEHQVYTMEGTKVFNKCRGKSGDFCGAVGCCEGGMSWNIDDSKRDHCKEG